MCLNIIQSLTTRPSFECQCLLINSKTSIWFMHVVVCQAAAARMQPCPQIHKKQEWRQIKNTSIDDEPLQPPISSLEKKRQKQSEQPSITNLQSEQSIAENLHFPLLDGLPCCRLINSVGKIDQFCRKDLGEQEMELTYEVGFSTCGSKFLQRHIGKLGVKQKERQDRKEEFISWRQEN